MRLGHGLELFNAAHFFDAHEALEDLWREAPRDSPVRRHLQGLVQLAVALHHQSTGNYVGARSVLKRGVRNLEGAEESFPELDLAALRSSLREWQGYLDQLGEASDGQGLGRTSPALPKISPVIAPRIKPDCV